MASEPGANKSDPSATRKHGFQTTPRHVQLKCARRILTRCSGILDLLGVI